jgi:hypothetical protein
MIDATAIYALGETPGRFDGFDDGKGKGKRCRVCDGGVRCENPFFDGKKEHTPFPSILSILLSRVPRHKT